jgi:hypothetical protein
MSMITAESKRALDKAIDRLKCDGYTVLMVLLDNKSEGSNEVVCSETNDPQLLRAMLKTAFERVFPTDGSAKENVGAVDDRPPVREWEVSSVGYGTSVTKYAPGQEPRRLTSISTECVHGDCDKCSGLFSREDYPGRLIMCVHECHLAQHHDSYTPLH